MKASPATIMCAMLASLLPCIGMVSPLQPETAQSFQEPAVTIEGHVRYEGGKPAKGYWVTLDSQSYQTQGHLDVIPFDIPRKAAGAVIVNDPNAVENHFTSARSAKVDSRGHYAFTGLALGTYSVVVSNAKNGEIRKSKRSIHEAAYQLPPAERLTVSGGQNSRHDFTLTISR